MTRKEKIQLLKDYESGEISATLFNSMTKPTRIFLQNVDDPDKWVCGLDDDDLDYGKTFTTAELQELKKDWFLVLLYTSHLAKTEPK